MIDVRGVADVARRLGEILGRPVRYAAVTDEAKREALLTQGVPAWNVDMIIEYLSAYATGWGDHITRDFERVVGRAPRDVGVFLRDHVEAFA